MLINLSPGQKLSKNSQLIEKAGVYGFSAFRMEMAERRLWHPDEPITVKVTRCDENAPIATEQTVPNVPDGKTIPFDDAMTATDKTDKTGKQEAKNTNSFSPNTFLSRRFLFAITFLFIGMALVVIVGSDAKYEGNPVLEGDGIVLENGFFDGDFLPATGRVSDLPAFNDYDGSLLVFIQKSPAGRHPNSGIWVISGSKAVSN